MTTTLNNVWKRLNNYFDIKAHCEKIAEERNNFDYDWSHEKLIEIEQRIEKLEKRGDYES